MTKREDDRALAPADSEGDDSSGSFHFGIAYPVVITIAFIALLAALFFTDMRPLKIFAWLRGPTGAIYVSSPGVYTRERLVNDRNGQDYWLRKQLALIDGEPAFSAVSSTKSSLSNIAASQEDEKHDGKPANPVGEPIAGIPGVVIPDAGAQAQVQAAKEAEQAAAKPVNAEVPEKVVPKLSLSNRYRLQSAERDLIRQDILENLLDDRHDLTGNSIYGLKFDTSVYPGKYTDGRAYVRVSISAYLSDLVGEEKDTGPASPSLPYHLRKYFESNNSDRVNNPTNANYASLQLFDKWVSNVMWRLNSHFVQLSEARAANLDSKDNSAADTTEDEKPLCLSKEGWTDMLETTVNTVLAMRDAKLEAAYDDPEAKFTSAQVILPEPWNRFLSVSVNYPRSKDPSCQLRPSILAWGIFDTVYVIAKSRPKDKIPSYLHLVDEVDKDDNVYFAAPDPNDPKFKPHYDDIGRVVRYAKLLHNENALISCEQFGMTGDNCDSYLSIPSGYFNFIKQVISPDLYAYSLYPRSEANALLSSVASDMNVGVPLTAVGSDSILALGANSSRDEAVLQPVAVGFTDARSSKSIELGWVIDVGGQGRPFQRSQFALISVPAWTSQLSVTVQSGWLNANSQEVPSAKYSYLVPTPPDYEAFDAFIGGDKSIRRPQIIDELFDTNEIKLTSCRRNTILIPGLRLWRGAVVTIGSEQADRITVLPNMRGVVAEFSNLPRFSSDKAKLRVWTSEGVDTAKREIRILKPAGCRDLETPVEEQNLPVEPAPG
jgi:hypothetical protein